MKFVCLGYLDEKAYDALDEGQRQAQAAQCLKYDEEVLRAGRHFLGGDCLCPGSTGRTVRMVNGKVQVKDGPYAETKEVLGGILHLEARDLEHAVELISAHPGLHMGPFEIREGMAPETLLAVSPEEEIRALIGAWSRALEAKDVDTMMSHYLEDAVLFDAIPPYKVVGRDKIAHAWRSCLPFFPDSFRSEHRDLTVQVEGTVAFVFGIHHFAVDDPNHPCGQTWMRVSLGLRKVGGGWKVAHEHISIPFNPMDNQAWMIADPDKVEAPDYGACAAT